MPLLEQPELRTARLHLREVRSGDAADLFAIHSDPEVMRYWSHVPWTMLAQAHEKIAQIAVQRATLPLMAWAIADNATDRLIGTTALFSIDTDQARAEIGYNLARQWHGKGLATEALQAVFAHAFQTLRLRRIEADVDPRNGPSRRLLERFGFVEEGLMRERWVVNGQICDSLLYGLLHREWAHAPG